MLEANILKHFVLLDLFLSLVALVPLYCGMPALSGDTGPEVQTNSPLLEEEEILKLGGGYGAEFREKMHFLTFWS